MVVTEFIRSFFSISRSTGITYSLGLLVCISTLFMLTKLFRQLIQSLGFMVYINMFFVLGRIITGKNDQGDKKKEAGFNFHDKQCISNNNSVCLYQKK